MRFTDAQVALFRAGISFVNMSPDVARQKAAREDFVHALLEAGTYVASYGSDHVVGTTACANFMVCVFNGASSEHVPVMFYDSHWSEYPDMRAYDESFMIPACVNGVGPMVVR